MYRQLCGSLHKQVRRERMHQGETALSTYLFCTMSPFKPHARTKLVAQLCMPAALTDQGRVLPHAAAHTTLGHMQVQLVT